MRTLCRYVTPVYFIAFGSSVRRILTGRPPTVDEIAMAKRIDPEVVASLNPFETAWFSLDVLERKKLQALVDTTMPEQDLTKFYNRLTTPVAETPAGDASAQMRAAMSVEELLQIYSQVMAHMKYLQNEARLREYGIYAEKDVVKLGLTQFKQERIEEAKVKIQQLQQEREQLNQKLGAYRDSVFTTSLFNEIINLLRIVGEKNESARTISVQMLDDMSSIGCQFNEQTKILLKNILFEDGPTENSSLLFSLIETPEMGEISAASRPLEEIGHDVLKTIAKRHEVQLTEGTEKQNHETNPQLQYSAE